LSGKYIRKLGELFCILNYYVIIYEYIIFILRNKETRTLEIGIWLINVCRGQWRLTVMEIHKLSWWVIILSYYYAIHYVYIFIILRFKKKNWNGIIINLSVAKTMKANSQGNK